MEAPGQWLPRGPKLEGIMGGGMRPAGGSGPCPPGRKNERERGGQTYVRPLSVQAEELSPEI